MELFFLSYEEIIFESFFIALMITYISIPSIVEVAKTKHLYDEPNGRTSHLVSTPSLGGLAIFIGFVISSMVFVNISKIPYIQYVLVGIIVLFFLGLKDDVVGLSASKKFIGQIIAASIVIDLGGIRFSGLYGFVGIESLSYYPSDFLTLFVIIGIINALNLIDGIDGLASGISLIVSLTFGAWFYLVGEYQLAILTAALVGSLLAFFRYNVFSKKSKLFMGDTGSLILGLLLAIFVIKFNDINESITGVYHISSSPAVSLGILIVPVFDTLRVLSIRIMRGGSPFVADKRHVHHYLLEITGSHRKATAIILLTNIFFIIISFLLSDLRIVVLSVILFVLASILSYIPYRMVRTNRLKKKKSEYQAQLD